MLRLRVYGLRCVQLVLVLVVCVDTSRAQTSSFTYQGKLTDGGGPATGAYDFQFTLWDALSGGVQQPQPSPVTVAKTNVAVSGGVFIVQLDFGPNAFPGGDRYLEIGARPTGGAAFTILSPRQPITSTPYSLRSLSTATADALSSACVNCVTSAQIQNVQGSQVSGPIPVAAVPAGSADYIQNGTTAQAASNFNISGNGTASGTLSANTVNATLQYNLNSVRAFSVSGGSTQFQNSNTFVGIDAGTSNTPSAASTSGNLNSFLGNNAGHMNTTGGENSYFGAYAGYANSTGQGNSFFGDFAGNSNTSGANNSFFGSGAGYSNTIASGNSFFGQQSGNSNTTGIFNSFFGTQAGLSNSTGGQNSFFGNGAGANNTTGGDNSFFGKNSGLANNTGGANSFFGAGAGCSNTTSLGNAFFGTQAALGNSIGNYNAFFGFQAGLSNTNGINNTFIGAVADFSISNATRLAVAFYSLTGHPL